MKGILSGRHNAAESVPIRCISLWQPWASLVALEEKRFETRSWATPYRGKLIIHAAKKWNRDLHLMALRQPFLAALTAKENDADLPLGAALCVVDLVACPRTELVRGRLSDKERAFGDYADGRYAWKLDNVRPFPEPIPMVGRQSLWECPADVRARLIEWGLL